METRWRWRRFAVLTVETWKGELLARIRPSDGSGPRFCIGWNAGGDGGDSSHQSTKPARRQSSLIRHSSGADSLVASWNRSPEPAAPRRDWCLKVIKIEFAVTSRSEGS